MPCPVPKVHTTMFNKYVERLVKLGILKCPNNSKYGDLYFSQARPKTRRLYFFRNFIILNRQIKCKPYSITNIQEMLLKLNDFKYAT